ncbi:thiolase C-terminal domain-containing protein [Corynebacterium efficiens]|nr:beta-ketoacyl synthase N-terminal-like domain-containing protein [Corynebacterium efficiens]
MRGVSVAGIGETPMGRYPDRGLREMIREAGNQAIEDSGIDPHEIDAVFVGNFAGQTLTGQGHLGPMVTETLGLTTVPAMRVEGACASGGLALLQAVNAIHYGIHDVVLVGGVEKMTHQSTGVVTGALTSAMDVELEAQTGQTFPGEFAMIAHRYFHEHRNIQREMAQVAVNAHDNALLNPHAQLHRKIDVDKVLGAPRIADPLGLFDCSLVTDGAAFLVLTADDVSDIYGGGRRHRRIRITGSGHGGDALTLQGKKSQTSFSATLQAASTAYAQAGRGADAVAEGRTALHGDMPINTSGGLKAKGHAVGATGISQAIEIITQLRGAAGDRQVTKADIGLTHNLGGTAATCVINIFEGE